MKRTLINLALPLIINILSINNSKAQKVDFSGNWKINMILSDFGNQPKYLAPTSLTISQSRNTITIERTTTKPDTIIRSVELLKFDGSTTENIISQGKKKIAKINWSPDNKALIESAEYFYTEKGEIINYRAFDKFVLSDDRKTLINSREMFSQTNFTLKIIYNKVD